MLTSYGILHFYSMGANASPGLATGNPLEHFEQAGIRRVVLLVYYRLLLGRLLNRLRTNPVLAEMHNEIEASLKWVIIHKIR